MYNITCCINQMKKRDERFSDCNGNMRICCRLTKELCVAQRWCPEQEKYIISERAKNICKNYK